MPELWTNWAREQRCAPARIERPGSEQELAKVVMAARGLPVRAVGAGHSFTDAACTDGVMVDLTRMSGIIGVDRSAGLATVQAGTTVHALGPALAAHGLALENQGDIDRQSLAGALATATHGTGARLGNMSSQVAGLRLVTAYGEIVELTPDTDPDGLRAARVSIGALGIISAVTLRCRPLYTLHRQDAPRPLAETLDHLDEHVDGNAHFEMFIFPYTDVAQTRTMRRSQAVPRPPVPWRRRLQEDLVENSLLKLICRTGRRFPAAAPRLNRVTAAAMTECYVEGPSYDVYPTRRGVRFTEMEYAIPRHHAREAVPRVLELIERSRLPILFPLEVRFVAADDAFLSPAHDRDTCYIAVHQFEGMEFETYFRAVEAIMDQYAGRPHWGKRHYQSAATLHARYPAWDRFQAVRARLDPHGTFTNDYIRRTLGPVPAATASTADETAPARLPERA